MRVAASGQLDLFAQHRRSPGETEELRALAGRLPKELRLGTSSWSFPGWRGIVWPDEPGWTESRCAQEGLAVYARHPLLTTVGIDRSYYDPLLPDALRDYASALPPGFQAISKVWEAYTLEKYAYGRGDSVEKASLAEENPHFFDVESFEETTLGPIKAHFAAHAGPLVLELPAGQPIERQRLLSRLSDFLHQASPRMGALHMVVEARDRRLLCDELGRMLGETGVPLCFTFHPTMPPLAEQVAWAARAGLLESGGAPLVARLMLPPGHSYEKRRGALAPFDRLVDPQPTMRRQVSELVGRAVRAGRTLFVVANNKAEGSAPLTLRALAEEIAAG